MKDLAVAVASACCPKTRKTDNSFASSVWRTNSELSRTNPTLHLPEQPIFCPLTNQFYAEHIARDWNAKDEHSDYTEYVLSFAVDAEYVSQFPTRTFGANEHTEHWIPAERLQEFNQHIIGKIQILAVYRR